MISIGGQDFEFNTLKKDPQIGYVEEYDEYIMQSGKIRRKIKGRRFFATFGYGILTDAQIGILYAILNNQKTTGHTAVEITTADGSFQSDAFVTVDNAQTRYGVYNGIVGWTNWNISIKGVDLV